MIILNRLDQTSADRKVTEFTKHGIHAYSEIGSCKNVTGNDKEKNKKKQHFICYLPYQISNIKFSLSEFLI